MAHHKVKKKKIQKKSDENKYGKSYSKKYKFVDSTFDLSDHTEKSRHFGQKNQVIIIICSAILLMVMLVLGLASYVWRKKLRKEGNLYDLDSYNFLCMITDF